MEAKIRLGADTLITQAKELGFIAMTCRQETPCGGPFFGFVVSWLYSPASRRGSDEPAASEPDFNLAYVLATASYCAYAVGAIDSDGEKLADDGRQRAFNCLKAAVKADPGHLAALKVEAQDVEAYFSPAKPQNAYLLIGQGMALFLPSEVH